MFEYTEETLETGMKTEKAFCNYCEKTCDFRSEKRSRWITIADIIPILPLGSSVNKYCVKCNNKEGSHSPISYLLTLVLFIGLVLFFTVYFFMIDCPIAGLPGWFWPAVRVFMVIFDIIIVVTLFSNAGN
ncbi:hypothetical protein KAJ27_17570 [bacterium]|nr:hypothetical protein [bacterium]